MTYKLYTITQLVDDSVLVNNKLKSLSSDYIHSLLEYKANPATLYYRDVINGIDGDYVSDNYYSVPMKAIEENRIDIIKLLVRYGLKQQVISEAGLTLLTYAIGLNRMDIVDLLTTFDFEINHKINGVNQFFYLIKCADKHALINLINNIEYLTKKGLNIYDKNKNGQMLHAALLSRQNELLEDMDYTQVDD